MAVGFARRQASYLLATFVLVGSMLIYSADRVNAGVCSGDSPAMSMDWRDNWWVGKDIDGSPVCDTAGQYVITIQRINWAHGYRNSTVDGYYGSNTQDDVELFQIAHGVARDGLVGNSTWGKYDNHPEDMECFASGECYWYYYQYNPVDPLWFQWSSFTNICSKKFPTTDFVWFDRTGPSGTNSC